MIPTTRLPLIQRQEVIGEAVSVSNVLQSKNTKKLDPVVNPDVTNFEFIECSGAIVTITEFRGGQEGQILAILGDGLTSIANNPGKIFNNIGAAKVLTANLVYRFTKFNDAWYEDCDVISPGGIGPIPPHTHDWTDILNTPTTLAGYGITDAYTQAQSDARFAPTVHTHPASSITTGTFGAGNYIFPANLTVTGTLNINTLNYTWPVAQANGVLANDGTGVLTWTPVVGGGVSSVTGTANRIQVAPNVGAVVVDISATYAGQASITTVGTITSGIWNGSVITSAYIGSHFHNAADINAGSFQNAPYTFPSNINIKSVTYSWPAANLLGVLRNDGSGNLTWSATAPPGPHTHPASDITPGTFATGNFAFNGQVSANAYWSNAALNEGVRLIADQAYISFFNGANTARSGYLQISIAALTLSTDLNIALYLSTSGTNRFQITGTGAASFLGNSVSMGALTATTGAFSGFLSVDGGTQFRGADNVFYEVQRVIGSGVNPGLFVKNIIASNTTLLAHSSSTGGGIFNLGIDNSTAISINTNLAVTFSDQVVLTRGYGGALYHAAQLTIVSPDYAVIDLDCGSATYYSGLRLYRAGVSKWLIYNQTDDNLRFYNTSAADAIVFYPSGSIGMKGSLLINSLQAVYLDGGSNTYIYEAAADNMQMVVGGSVSLSLFSVGAFFSGYVVIPPNSKLYFDGGSDTYMVEIAANQLRTVVGGVIVADIVTGYFNIYNHIALAAGKALFLDGGGDTYITEAAANMIRIVAAGSPVIDIIAGGVIVYGYVSVAPNSPLYFDGGGDTYMREVVANDLRTFVGNNLISQQLPGEFNVFTPLTRFGGNSASAETYHTSSGGGDSTAHTIWLQYITDTSYALSMNWRTLQFGNNGLNQIIAGSTAAGGQLEIWTNNTARAIRGVTANGFRNALFANNNCVFYGTITFNNLAYVWPAANASGFLKNDGSGNLTWLAGGTGTVTGSGTTNTIPVWSSSSALTDSILTQPASNVIQINTSSASAILRFADGLGTIDFAKTTTGTITMTNSLTSTTMSFLMSSVLPNVTFRCNTTNVGDLGTSSLRWRNVYGTAALVSVVELFDPAGITSLGKITASPFNKLQWDDGVIVKTIAAVVPIVAPADAIDLPTAIALINSLKAQLQSAGVFV